LDFQPHGSVSPKTVLEKKSTISAFGLAAVEDGMRIEDWSSVKMSTIKKH